MKLRTIIPAAAAVALCFSACSNDDTQTGNGPDTTVDEGDPASFTLSISEPAATRAQDDNALSIENDFYTADVFIYTASKQLTKHVRLQKSEFSNVGPATDHVWTTKTPIVTTEGLKYIYVGLNLPQTLGEQIAATNNMTGLALVSRADTYDLASTSTGFVMFSTKQESEDLVAGANNSVTVDVARLVAKVTVEEGPALKYDVIGGKVSNLEFGIRNSNLKFFPFQQKDGTTIIDPNHYDNSWAAGDFKHDALSAYVPVDAYDTPVLTRKVKYTAENTTAMRYQYETTYASLKAIYVPTKITEADGTVDDNPNTNPATQSTFWVVTLKSDGQTHYFTDEDDAKTFANANDGTISDPYVNGACYYNLFLNPSGNYQTIRNTFYQCRVLSIAGLGNPNPEDEGDKKEPIPDKANITVDINIVPWVLQLDEYELF